MLPFFAAVFARCVLLQQEKVSLAVASEGERRRRRAKMQKCGIEEQETPSKLIRLYTCVSTLDEI